DGVRPPGAADADRPIEGGIVLQPEVSSLCRLAQPPQDLVHQVQPSPSLSSSGQSSDQKRRDVLGVQPDDDALEALHARLPGYDLPFIVPGPCTDRRVVASCSQ